MEFKEFKEFFLRKATKASLRAERREFKLGEADHALYGICGIVFLL